MHDRWTNADLASLLGEPILTRRDMLVTSLATGFALAVQPVSADTITTGIEGLIVGEVRIPVKDGEIPAYRAMPDKGTNFPVVLVVLVVLGAPGPTLTATLGGVAAGAAGLEGLSPQPTSVTISVLRSTALSVLGVFMAWFSLLLDTGYWLGFLGPG